MGRPAQEGWPIDPGSITSYWLLGPPRTLGRNYYLGAELLGAVYHHQGWERTQELIAEPACLLKEFNRSADALPYFADGPRFSTELAEGLYAR